MIMRFSKRRIGISALGLAVVATILFGGASYYNQLQEPQNGGLMLGNFNPPESQRRQEFKQWQNGKEKHSSIKSAKDNLPSNLASAKLPDLKKLRGKSSKIAAATEEVIGVYLLTTSDDTASTDRELLAYFAPKKSQKDKDDGIDPQQAVSLEVLADSIGLDIDAYMAQEAEAVEEGASKADTPVVRIDVNGNPGIGYEPGYNVFGETKIPRGGSVSWWDNGLTYTVGGSEGPDGTSLETLLEIAEEIAQSEPAQ